MGKLVGAVALCCMLVVLSVTVLVSAVFGGASPASGPSAPGSAAAPTGGDRTPALPAGWAQLEQAAAATCPGLSWTVLASIGTVESDSGRSTAPGVASGANGAGAEGPMQFEPSSFPFGTYAIDWADDQGSGVRTNLFRPGWDCPRCRTTGPGL